MKLAMMLSLPAVALLVACSGSSTPAIPAAAPATNTPVASVPAASMPAGSMPAASMPAGSMPEGSMPGASMSAGTPANTSSGGGCAGFTAGKNGVIQTFCDGKATVKITIGSATHTLGGGDCAQSGGFFAVNIGVVTAPTSTGTKPDYFGALFAPKAGPFTESTVTAYLGGTPYLVKAAGTVASGFSGVTFSGKTLQSMPVSGTVTC